MILFKVLLIEPGDEAKKYYHANKYLLDLGLLPEKQGAAGHVLQQQEGLCFVADVWGKWNISKKQDQEADKENGEPSLI